MYMITCYLCDMEIISQLSQLLGLCAGDIENIVKSGHVTLDAQVRAYDLLSLLLENGLSEEDEAAAEHYLKVYGVAGAAAESAYDGESLKNAVKARMAPLERACTDARFEAASVASLHEFAKETFQTWQTAGIFMRKRALKALRERAGFKLESHRIGNYVAKTFDLMNDAQMRFAKAQQKLFAADVTYKVQPGIYARIREAIAARQQAPCEC